MDLLSKTYDSVVRALAVIASALIAAMFVAIIYDVILRSLSMQPPFWTTGFTEYSMVYVVMLGMPWLVRNKSHVAVESLIVSLPYPAQRVIERLVYVFCFIISVLLTYHGAKMTVDVAVRGEIDYRMLELPKWILFAGLPIGFGLSAVEFLRFLFGTDKMYQQKKEPRSEGM